MKELIRLLMITGLMLLAAGVLLYLLTFITGGEKLPGDIIIKGKRMTFYFPIVSCIVVSVLLTIVLNVFFRAH